MAIGSVVDEGNGNYSATILPSRAGYSSLHVTMRGAHVAESPYDLLVIPGEVRGFIEPSNMMPSDPLSLSHGFRRLGHSQRRLVLPWRWQ